MTDASGSIVGAVEVFDDATRLRDAIERAETARPDALTGPLTNLPNRRQFDAALAGRPGDLRRYGWPFGVLIADIDHFKDVNDRHGHEAGTRRATRRCGSWQRPAAVRGGPVTS